MPDTTTRIAIIEDNTDLREELQFFLQSKGYAVWGSDSAETFWKQLHRHPVGIVLVDIELPGENGFSVVDYLRTLSGYGVIVMSARGSQQDKLHGLSLGADAYLVKPVNFAKLACTITSLWHRLCLSEASKNNAIAAPIIENSPWVLNRNALTTPCGTDIQLTQKEYELFEILFRHRNEVCSKEQLHSLLFGYEIEPDTHRIDVILSRIRAKVRKSGAQLPLRTIFGKGIVLLDQ